MKNRTHLITLAALGTLPGVVLAGPSGGSFEITWYTIDAGGVHSAAGGDFELSGTVGQPDAGGPMTGGSFSLTGGFWPGVSTTVCPADINGDGVVNFFDVSAFLQAFNSQQAPGDFNNDGSFNFFDVSAFLLAFTAGCP